MRSWTICASLVLLLAVPALAQRRPVKSPISAEQFKPLLEQLKSEGKAFAEAGDDAAPAPWPAMKDAWFVGGAADFLAPALQDCAAGGGANLYVAWQLCQPLLGANDELLRKLEPQLSALLDRCTFKPMPTLDAVRLQALIVPEGAKGPDAQQRLRRRDEVLAEKQKQEHVAVKHNRSAAALAKTLKQLLVMMASPAADDKFLARLEKEQKEQWNGYLDSLAVVKSEAVRMSRERAKKYYARLKELAAAPPEGKRKFADPTSPKYDDKTSSSFPESEHHFAREVVEAINLVCTQAGEPALLLPDTKDKDKPRDRRGDRPGRGTRGGN